MTNNGKTKAKKIKELLLEISPLIEEYTSKVCPDCTDICCKQKRAVLDPNDVSYVGALGIPLPAYDPARPPDGPCQFMGPNGCITPRWLRPWRCTWYFCDPLLNAMSSGPQKKARKISALIQNVVDIRTGW